MQLDLDQRHALVCGASRGIGRAVANELARLGATVTVLARSREVLEQVVAELATPNPATRHGLCVADMRDTAALARAVRECVAGRRVEILVHNSGGPPAGRASEAQPEDFAAAFAQHVISGQVLLQHVLAGMREAGYGRLVNIISTSVKEPIANLGVSNTVRAAVAAWAKTLSGELAGDGITVNNVLPGFTETDRLSSLIAERARAQSRSETEIAQAMRAQVPAGRFGKPDEIAAVATFLCTPAAAYVNGVSIAVDGGRTRSLS